MRHIYAKFLLLAGFSLISQVAQAQKSNKENSPYSRFGVGEVCNGANTFLKGMANTSSAYASSFNVNTENPASYSYLTLTTYEAGASGNTRTVLGSTDKYKTGSANLAYMDIGIPLGKYAGMAIGLKPVTRVYYYLTDTSMVDSFGKAVKSYQGDGSLNQGFIGFAGKYKGLSLGFNFGYVFGTTITINSLEPTDESNKVLSSQFYTRTKTGGVYWNLGAMYQHDLNDKLFLRGGATLTLSQQLNASRDKYWISYLYQADTALSLTDVKGKIQMPMSYSAGLQLVGNNKWSTSINYAATNWSNYTNYGTTDSLAATSYKLSVGAEYTPDAASIDNYLQKVTYRIGGYYGKDPVMLRGTQLDYYAVTAGCTLPFRKNISRVHMSLEVGSRGTKANGLVRENFVRFGVGLSLNDKWFIKRKYD